MKNIKDKLSQDRVKMIKRLPIDNKMNYSQDPNGSCTCLMCRLYHQFSLADRLMRIRASILEAIYTSRNGKLNSF